MMSLTGIIFLTIFIISTTQGIPYFSEIPALYDLPEVLRDNANVTYRLPDNVVPSHYRIKLIPDLQNSFTFTGSSIIEIKVIKTTKTIVLHAQNIEITGKISLTNVADATQAQETETHSIETTNNFLTITFPKDIAVGSYNLTLAYKGEINNYLRGFYRGNYTDGLGRNRSIASTHFEPVGARLAFPCWDEPALKAYFTISIRHNRDYTALSNTQLNTLQTVEDNDNEVWSIFKTTPKMSTYLVAYVVADFDHLSNENDQSFRVWARKNAINHGMYAVDVGLKELTALEKYIGITFKSHGLTKMDSIALPQLSAGAMENWGLVTYRENGLLFKENVSSLYDKEGIAKVISHEFAHQWFGNLVSPKWWTYVWLNEGFANYFQYVITDMVETDWRLIERFVVENLQNSAFGADSLNTSHPMDVNVLSPKEITSIFDSITYSKAASVIRMISHIMGEDKFKTGLKNYLTAKQFDVATSDDLFNELTKVVDETMKPNFLAALKNWATTPGFPVVTVVRNYTTKTATIIQSRFSFNQTEVPPSSKYYVAINCATPKDFNFNDTSSITWFKSDENSTDIPAADENEWLICNKQQFGYYRVNYDEKNWNLITKLLAINHTGIHVLNRAQLIDDAFNLARAGYIHYNITLPLIGYLKEEVDFIPWSSAWNGISYLNRVLTNTEHSQVFREYITGLTGKLIESVHFNESSEDSHITKLQRIKLIENTCAMGLKSCSDYALSKLNMWLNNSETNPLSVDLKKVIICSGVRSADKNTWNKLLLKYKENYNDDDILTGLGCTSDTVILKMYLEMAINSSLPVINRDTIFKAVYTGSDVGVDVTLDFLKEKIHYFLASEAASAATVKSYITDIGSRMTNQSQIEKIKEIRTLDTSLLNGIIDEGLKRAQSNVEWLKSRSGELEKFFKKDPVTPPTNDHDSGVTFTASLLLTTVLFALTLLH